MVASGGRTGHGLGRAPQGPPRNGMTGSEPTPAPGFALGEQRAIVQIDSAVANDSAAPANALARLAGSYIPAAAATAARLGLDPGEATYGDVVAALLA